MKTYEDCKKKVAQMYKLGNTLVTGHRATYFEEAAELYAESKVKNLSLSDVSQRSELLIDFINWYDNLGKDLFDNDGYDIIVSHYLKSINCG